MTGYLYQCELALLELARHSWQDATIEVRMELLDDIEFLSPQDNTPLELLQSKHREAAGPLSETGKDFWRSVASWIDALKNLSDPSEAVVFPDLRTVFPLVRRRVGDPVGVVACRAVAAREV
ncbi:ABC-three component system protein, partial [Streptomyces sp. S6]